VSFQARFCDKKLTYCHSSKALKTEICKQFANKKWKAFKRTFYYPKVAFFSLFHLWLGHKKACKANPAGVDY
jgi:hypothetical protein